MPQVSLSERRTRIARPASKMAHAIAYRSSIAGISITRLSDGRILEANNAWFKLFGVRRREVIGTSIRLRAWMRPGVRKRMVRDLLRKGTFQNREMELRKASGTEFVGLLSARLARLDGERVIISSLIDITARKRAEEALRQLNTTLEQRVAKRTAELRRSEEQFRTLVQASSDVVYRMSRDWKEMRQLVGRDFITDTATPRRSWLRTYIHPDDQATVMAVIRKALRTKRVFELEHRVKRVDGTLGWTFSRAIPIFDAKGRIVEWLGMASDITARKQAEQALQENETRLRLSAQAANVGFWDWNLRTGSTYFSPEWKRQLGYTPDEIPNRFEEWRRRLHPDDEKQTLRQIRDFLADPKGQHEVEFRLRHRDGSYRWINALADVLRDAKGRPVRMLGCHLDITKRKQAEHELRASEERFRAIYEKGPIGIAVGDLRGRLMFANPAFHRILGYAEGELAGMNFRQFTAREFVPIENRLIADMVEGRRSHYEIEKRYIRKDGRPVWISLCTTILRDADSLPALGLAMVQDISERKASELERARLATILETSSDAIIAIDARRRITSWNTGAERLYGYPAGEALGKPVSLILPADRRAAYLAMLDQVFRRGQPAEREDVHVTQAGRHVYVSVAISPIRDARGAVVGSSAIARDISERRRLEAEIQNVSEAERQRIGRDLHDGLSQSLAGMNYLAEGLLKALRRKNAEETGEMERLSRHLHTTTRQAHEMTRGLFPVVLETGGLLMALHELAHATEDLFGVSCTVVGSPTLSVKNEKTARQLYRIAQEAVNNSAKHSRGNRIWILLRRTRSGLCLTVRDDGRGISVRQLHKADMGLHIMRYRANAIGARLDIASTPGKGTTVTCRLPARINNSTAKEPT